MLVLMHDASDDDDDENDEQGEEEGRTQEKIKCKKNILGHLGNLCCNNEHSCDAKMFSAAPGKCGQHCAS